MSTRGAKAVRYVYLALSIVVYVVGLTVIGEIDREHSLQSLPRMLNRTSDQLEFISNGLREYHKATGRYPTNDEGLLVVKSLAALHTDEGWRHPHNEYLLRVSDVGVVSVFGEPFIYENRRGLPADKFAGSDATADGARHYSKRVDDGIYVWSLGARDVYHEYKRYTLPLRVAAFAIGVFCSLLIVAFIRAEIRVVASGPSKVTRAAAIIWAVFSGFFAVFMSCAFFPSMIATCYLMSAVWHRTPRLTREYIQLTSEYHDRGIIGDSAYKKITEAMKEPY